MAQTWQLGVVPVRPGTYYRREREGVTVEGATNGILAVLFQSNWGALNKVVDVGQTDLNNLEEIFGTGAGVEAIRQGLLGGATTIRAVRVGNDDGTCASVILKTPPQEVSVTVNHEKILTATITAETSESELEAANLPINDAAFASNVEEIPAITVTSGNVALVQNTDYTLNLPTSGAQYFEIALTASGKAKLLADETITDNFSKDVVIAVKWTTETLQERELDAAEIISRYEGARDFTVTVRDNLITDKRQVLIYDGAQIFTAVSFDAGVDEAQALVDALNGNEHFKARKLQAGILADVAQIPLTGGTNPTATNASYTRGTEILEQYSWNCIVADSDEAGVSGILTAFVKQSYETGQLGMAVVAGKATQDLEQRMSWAAACNDEKVVYVLSGFIGLDGVNYDGWRTAARIGGMIAACETNAAITHSVITDALELAENLSNGQIIRAEQKGCLVLSLNAENQVQVDAAINTLITAGTDMDDGWKKIRRTKCRFELMDRINRTCDKLVGFLNNDVNGRTTVVAAMQKVINEMVAESKLFAGSYAEEDARYKPEADKAYFLIHCGDIDSMEKIMLSYRFSYANPFE